MNWGWKITIVYSLFVVGILTLVFKARSERVDLVATDYYAQELAYSKRLEAMRNATAMNEKPIIKHNGKEFTLELPSYCTNLTNGIIDFYCPTNSSRDRRLSITGESTQRFSLNDLPAGVYLIKLSFDLDEKPYYFEQALEWN